MKDRGAAPRISLHLIRYFLHLLIKSISPSLPTPPSSLFFPSLPLYPPLSVSICLTLALSISLTLALPCVSPQLQLIDDERNLPRTGALLKTGQRVLSVGANGDRGGELWGDYKEGCTPIPPPFPLPIHPIPFYPTSAMFATETRFVHNTWEASGG